MKKKRMIIVFSILIIFAIIGLNLISKTVVASSSNKQNNKLFTSIKLEEGDTLWSIATEYKTNEYKNITEYIREIKRCNGIDSDTINEGQYIIVPYYTNIMNFE